MMGAGIMDASQIGKDTRLSGASTPDPVVFSKMSPTMLNLNWGFEESNHAGDKNTSRWMD